MDEQRSDDDGMPEHADKAAAESAARPLASVLKREILAAEYHARASQASALAAASPLDRVREKHEAAADRWRLLAALNERDRRMAPAEAPATHLDPVA